MKIGVLASQGAFAEHIAILNRLKVATVPVRQSRELESLDGLIIPGGESSTISGFLLADNLAGKIRDMAGEGLPIWGTCAGMILLAEKVEGSHQQPLGLMAITVVRNAFGRQRESFETELSIPVLGEVPFPGVFIRAPIIEHASDGVEVLARLADETIVAVRQGKLLGAAFHPELTDDLRFHQYFLNIVAKGK